MTLQLSELTTFAAVYILAVAGILGAVMGSALNCLAYRIAHEKKWAGGRSVCPMCGHALGILDLVPVLSWLFLRGRCRHCGEKISPRYILTELLLAVCFMSVLWKFGITLECVTVLVLCACMLSLSLVDLDIQIIPDRFLLIPVILRAAWLLYDGSFMGLWRGIWPGLALGGGVLILSLIMDKVLGKDSMGGGDIKLMAVLGTFLTFPECLFMLIVACIAGILIAAILQKAKPDTPFPFGPALSLAGWVALLAGDTVVGLYTNLFM